MFHQITFFLIIQAIFIQSEQVGKVWEVSNRHIQERLYPNPESFHEHESVLDTYEINANGAQKKPRNIDEDQIGDAVSWRHNIGKRSVETLDETSKENIADSKNFSQKYSDDKKESRSFDDSMYSNREARGATKEQWIKQPYPVDFNSRVKDPANDQLTSNTDQVNVRAPRVHFVTNQKRFDTAESRNREPEVVRSSTASPRATRMYNDQRVDYNSRSPDPYEYRADSRRRKSYMDRDYNQYDLDPPRYNPVATSRYNEYDLDLYKSPNPSKKRIIYYTTLPEIVRSPPNVDLRYRSPEPPILSPPYNDYYMKRYHDGRVTSSPVVVSDNGNNYYRGNQYDDRDRDGYRYPPPGRNDYPMPPPQRYLPNYRPFQGGKEPDLDPLRPIEDRRRYPPPVNGNTINKERMTDNSRPDYNSNRPASASTNSQNGDTGSLTGYPPVKISTGVNVKDSDRKVPERRIYADREREYVYALPSFQLADDESYNSSPYYEDARSRY